MSSTLEVKSPLSGQVWGSYACSDAAQLSAQMTLARQAATIWRELTVAERVRRLSPLLGRLLSEHEALCECLVQVSGKVATEALISEIYPTVDLLRYYLDHASAILAPRRVYTSPWGFPNAGARIYQQPFGVTAIIAPWNLPFQLCFNPLVTALLAGNAVIFKMSEFSVPLGEWIPKLFKGLELPHGLIQQCIGGAECGSLLIDSHPDLVFFTGSLPAGRKVMAQAAQFPIPVLLELGGKDAMVVFADANLTRACHAALYGAFSNSGQVCVSVERLLVQRSCYESLRDSLCRAIRALQLGHGEQGDLGAVSTGQQLNLIQAHYQDALAKGAKSSGPLEITGNYVKPLLLWDVSSEMRVLQEESFGPLLIMQPFDEEQDAVRLVNASEFGLNASIWTRDYAKAERVAARLEVGNLAINDVLKNIGHPRLPFGGVKQSGFGRYHGEAGLLAFSNAKSVLTNWSGLNYEPNWFPYGREVFGHLSAYLELRFGQSPLLQRIWRQRATLKYFWRFAQWNLRQHGENCLVLLGKTRLKE